MVSLEKFYAKSNGETIQEHTDKLLTNLELLKKFYPNINVKWDLLRIACIYHDLGKINTKFQKKIKKSMKEILENEVPHGFLSVAMMDFDELEKMYEPDEIKALVAAVAHHHERNFDLKENDDLYEDEMGKLERIIKNFKYENLKFGLKAEAPPKRYWRGDKPDSEKSPEVFLDYLMLKGFLNRLDYAASADEFVETKNDFLENHLEEMLKNFSKDGSVAKWNDLQKYMVKNKDENLVVVAQTGMGKTEAGLLWIGNNKGFFTLPLKTAINAIFKRISKGISEDLDKKIGLLHSQTYREYMELKPDENGEFDIDSYYTKTKQLSMPLTICTIDQIFDFVYRYKGFELKPATLSYSKIIIDEIQMYSPNLLAYIVYGLEYITKLGGKFAIVTATMPPFLLDILKAKGIEFKNPKPFLNSGIRHSIKVIHEKINAEFIKERYDNNRVLVICNTIKEAQQIHKNLDELGLESTLFHSSFIKKDRKAKEEEILKIGRPTEDSKEKKKGIWVCTQVVEASLDIDFDILITELSDISGLFQRMGRCYRNRDFNQDGYNCFVFDGGDKRCSGVGAFIDNKIFELSKEALTNDLESGYISEQKKIELIEKVYSTKNIKGTQYCKQINNTIEYLEATYNDELKKSEVAIKFRDIKNFTIIPKVVFDDEANNEKILNLIEILKTKQNRNMTQDEIKDLKKRKIKARNELFEFTMQVPVYLIKDYDIAIEEKEINSYELIYITDIAYDSRVGLQISGIKKVKANKLDLGDRIF